MQPLKVNFTEEEASSKAREVPPSGEYHVALTDGSLEVVKPGRKNTGKQYWKCTFVIQEDKYKGVTIFSTVMLFDGALYSLSQLMSALGYNVNSGEFQVPHIDELFGKELIVRGIKRPAFIGEDGKEISERFEIKSYKPLRDVSGHKATTSNPLP